MRVVLDANVFVSAPITPHGVCRKFSNLFWKIPKEFELILTERMIIETIASLNKPRIIRYLKQSSESLRAWMEI